jgi:hypothetical protein
MSSGLAVPVPPDNLRGRFGSYVESDVYHICDRIKEIDSRLRICVLEPPVEFAGKTYNFSVVELCPDGVERLVYRTEALDARIVEHLQYLLRVPFDKRFAEAERIEAKHEAEQKQRDFEEYYERVGRPMMTDLERCGFITRGISYPKRGVKP